MEDNVLFPSFVTSQGDTAPKLGENRPRAFVGFVTSQGDTAPKRPVHDRPQGMVLLPVRATLLQNLVHVSTPFLECFVTSQGDTAPKLRLGREDERAVLLPVRATLLQNRLPAVRVHHGFCYQSGRHCSKTDAQGP